MFKHALLGLTAFLLLAATAAPALAQYPYPPPPRPYHHRIYYRCPRPVFSHHRWCYYYYFDGYGRRHFC